MQSHGEKERLGGMLLLSEVKSWRAIMIAFQAIYRELEKALLAEGCTISRFQILLLLYFDGPLPAAELAKRMFVTRGNISTFLRRIEADGLIKKENRTAPAKRLGYVLTADGERLFEELFPRHVGRIQEWVTPLSQRQLDALYRIAGKVEPKLPRF